MNRGQDPADFIEVAVKYQRKMITSRQAAAALNMPRRTFLDKFKEHTVQIKEIVEKIQAINEREYYLNHKGLYRTNCKQYYQAHQDQLRERARKYFYAHKPEFAERQTINGILIKNSAGTTLGQITPAATDSSTDSLTLTSGALVTITSASTGITFSGGPYTAIVTTKSGGSFVSPSFVGP